MATRKKIANLAKEPEYKKRNMRQLRVIKMGYAFTSAFRL